MPDEPNAPTPHTYTLEGLKPKHRKFVECWLESMNDAEAARDAGYADHREGYRLRRREDISAVISQLLSQHVMGPGEALVRLGRIAKADMTNFLVVSPTARTYWVPALEHDGVIELAKSRGLHPTDLDVYDLDGHFGADNVARTSDGTSFIRVQDVISEVDIDWKRVKYLKQLGLIKKIKKSKDGTVEFELHDTVRALELVGKHHKLFTDKVDLGGDGGSLRVEIVRRVVGPSEDDA
ncbi:terminase small subunit [Deinococcus pimensis]|uniref:terminase small subunit n=1 Tax=Deinococcus pimensis TaxID=309888 RepID=UPI00047F7F6E|nr:terminase small subunit [Deinococcus pimensis]